MNALIMEVLRICVRYIVAALAVALAAWGAPGVLVETVGDPAVSEWLIGVSLASVAVITENAWVKARVLPKLGL